jgi:hypothetical protein
VSGGDFMSKAEAQLCGRRRIDSREFVVKDLQRVLAPCWALISLAPGYIDRVIERRSEINSKLLVELYGAGGKTLRTELMAAVAQAAAGKRAALRVVTVPPAEQDSDAGGGPETGFSPSGQAGALRSDVPPAAGGEAADSPAPPPPLHAPAPVMEVFDPRPRRGNLDAALIELEREICVARADWLKLTAEARQRQERIDALERAIEALKAVAA